MKRIGVDQSIWNSFVSGEATEIQKNIKTSKSYLEVFNIDFDEDFLYLHKLGYGQIQFHGCFFTGTLRIEHDEDWTLSAKVLDFIDCKFDKITVYGNNTNLSITIHNFITLNELHVEGRIKCLKVNNEISDFNRVINKIGLNANPDDVHTTIELQRIHCKLVQMDSIDRTRITFDEAVVGKLDWGGSEHVSMYSKKSRFAQTVLEGFSGHLEYISSMLGTAQINGGYTSDDEEYNVTFKETIAGRIEFIYSLSLGQISIGAASCIGTLAFGEIHAKEINVSHSLIGWLVVPIKVNIWDTFDLSGSEARKLHINRLSFLKGTFEQQADKKVKPKIILENLTLSALDFISFHNNAYLYVSDVKYTEEESLQTPSDSHRALSSEFLQMCDDNNIPVPVFEDVEGEFRVIRSDLGKINFISCDFSEMEMLFVASKINEIFLAGTEMPRSLSGRYAERQIGYAQLKKINDNRGDSVRSNEYLALELEAHYESLHEKKRTIAEYFDKVTLFANKYSNRFNQSWVLTLCIGIPVMGLLYAGYCLSLGFVLDTGFEKNSMLTFRKLLSLFPEFIYPIHVADYVAKAMHFEIDEIPDMARLMEFLCRAVNGYFFYQFIQAFRKFGKK
jgi:hypothetical protein